MLAESYEGITGLLTIARVDVTADLSEANVYFSVVGQDEGEVLEILNSNIYEIQGFLNKKLFMRKLPRISFVIDQRSQVEERINKLIDTNSDQ